MKVFEAHYFCPGRFGTFEQIDAVVVANTKEEALGLVLEEFPSTVQHWSFKEVDTDKVHIRTLHRECN